MGLSDMSFGELLLILVAVLLVFGSKRLPGIASNLGSAIRDFRRSVSGDDPTGSQGTTGAESVRPQDSTPNRPA